MRLPAAKRDGGATKQHEDSTVHTRCAVGRSRLDCHFHEPDYRARARDGDGAEVRRRTGVRCVSARVSHSQSDSRSVRRRCALFRIRAVFRCLSCGGRRKARPHGSQIWSARRFMLVVGLFCVAGMIFSPQLVWLFAPGYAAVPGKFELAVRMTRIMFPFPSAHSFSCASDGDVECFRQVRRAGDGLHVLQHWFRLFRTVAWILAGSADRHHSYRGHGVSALCWAECFSSLAASQPHVLPDFTSGSISIGVIPDCSRSFVS